MKRQNDRILKEELPRSVGALYVTRDQWRNNSRKNEEAVVTHLEPDILEYEVKWALGSITINKASGSDGFPA